MKKVLKKIGNAIVAMFVITLIMSCKSETKTTTISFGVRGNCGMCKKTIESAVTNLEGVASANWVIDKKKIEVAYDASKVNENKIHNAIAISGYDTDKEAGNEDAYENLPACCQYDHTMKMSLD